MLRGGVDQISQFLIESTSGAATRYSKSLSFMLDREFDRKNFRGSGSKINTVKVHHKKNESERWLRWKAQGVQIGNLTI